jgi:hypothetical protein
MRSTVAAIASTIGAVAFQLVSISGKLNSYTWLTKYLWMTSAALWVVWLLSHPKILGSRSKAQSPPHPPVNIDVSPNISPTISPTFINLTSTAAVPEMPANRPKIVLASWDTKSEHMQSWHSGFNLDNHGSEAALQVQVQRFQISPTVSASSAAVPTIGAHDRELAHVWVEGFLASDKAKWDLLEAMKKAAHEKQGIELNRPDYTINIRVTYRDFDNEWYESTATLSYMPAGRGSLRFSDSKQKKIPQP